MTNNIDIHSLKVLVVDDHMMMRSLIAQALRGIGIDRIENAQTGDEAIKRINLSLNSKNPYHIIFLDWHMPGMNGIDVLRICRDDKRMDKTAIVMLTAEQEQKSILSAIEIGATSYLIKPVSRDTIEKNITKIFSWIEKNNPEAQSSEKFNSTLAPEALSRELKPVISKGMKNIFSEMFYTEIIPDNQISEADQKKMVCIGIMHQNNITIALRFFFDEDLLRPLLRQLYSPEHLKKRSVYEDAACEIVNILCAQVKSFLNEHGYSLEFDLPRMGTDDQQCKTPDSIMNVRFSINEEQCFLVDLLTTTPDT